MEFEILNLNDELSFENVTDFNLNPTLPKSNLLILHVNIRSIRKNHVELEALINSFQQKPDVIVCSEARLIDEINFVNINGYSYFLNNSRINICDGVVTYVRNEIQFEIVNEKFGNLETSSIIVELSNKSSLKITGLYRCHDYDVDDFVADLGRFIVSNKLVKNHVIVGDNNLDLIKFNKKTEEYFYQFLQSGYQSMINTCTHPNRNCNEGTCIDHIFAKGIFQSTAGKFLNSITDHYPIFLSIHDNNMKLKQTMKFLINKKRFLELCTSENWDEVLNVPDDETVLDLLISKLQNIHLRSLKQIPRVQRPRNSWITLGLINSVNVKDKLYRIWKNDLNNLTKKDQYLNYEKVLKSLLRSAKNKFERNQIQNADSKKMWKYVHSKLETQFKNRQIDEILINNHPCNNYWRISNHFNEFFSTIVSNLNINAVPPLRHYDIPIVPINQHSLFLSPTSEFEVLETIHQLKNKSGGSDQIHANTIKLAAPFIAPILCHIINNAMLHGKCPSQFKTAVICPVFKSGSKKLVNNYRPIALISNLAKVFEKILYFRLYKFSTKYGLISSRQFGFLKNKGTDDAIALLSEFIYENLNVSKPTLVAFLDYSKAFDTVNHKILLSKLHNMGIRGVCLDLIESYLKDRSQVVKVNGVKSQSVRINVGVPQGSILGPLLFILYINDLLSFQTELFAYADDTAVPLSCSNWSVLAANMSQKLDVIYSWLYQNNLILNVNKSTFITFGNYSDSVPRSLVVTMNGQSIKRVNKAKYLGIIYDYNMKWDLHVDSIVKKTKYLVYVFHRLEKVLSKNQLLQVYYGLFNSIAVYGIIGWGGLYEVSLSPLRRLQQRIFRVVGVSVHDINKPLNIRQVFTLKSIVYMYIELKNFFLSTPINTRFRSISLPKKLLKIGQRSYKYYAFRYFNELPLNLKTLYFSKNVIKKRLKQAVGYMSID